MGGREGDVSTSTDAESRYIHLRHLDIERPNVIAASEYSQASYRSSDTRLFGRRNHTPGDVQTGTPDSLVRYPSGGPSAVPPSSSFIDSAYPNNLNYPFPLPPRGTPYPPPSFPNKPNPEPYLEPYPRRYNLTRPAPEHLPQDHTGRGSSNTPEVSGYTDPREPATNTVPRQPRQYVHQRF